MPAPQFQVVTGDLVRLVESPHEKAASNLENMGGIQGVARALNVDLKEGLNNDDQEAITSRQAAFGSNYIPPPRSKNLFELMWDAFQDLTIMVLAAAGVLEIILSQTVSDHPETAWIEGACILFAVVVVVLVTAVNDYQKEKQFRALNAVKEDEKIKVIRNGVPCEVSKWNIVVGDIVRVDLGDIICADGIVFDEQDLKLDESSMTGESDLLTKNRENPFLLSGTKVMEGLGKMLVVCVGENSQAGIIKKLINGKGAEKKKNNEKEIDEKMDAETMKIASPRGSYVEMATPNQLEEGAAAGHGGGDYSDDDDDEPSSPLEAKLYKLTVLIGKLGTAAALLVFFVMSIKMTVKKFAIDGEEWKSAYVEDYLRFFTVAITVLVVAIPEGLPLAVTISLAYSVKKMLQDNNLVRHLDACETMGSATTVCSDKTGTLTTNRMTVMQVWLGGEEFSSSTEAAGRMSEKMKDVFCNGICINSTAEILPSKVPGGQPEHTGNKTECALLQFVRNCGVEYPEVRSQTEIAHMLTFSSAKKRMSVVVKLSETSCRIYTKGATEVVLGLCDKMQMLDGSVRGLAADEKRQIGASVIEKYASQGYRTLCLSYRDVDCSADQISQWADEDIERDLTCIAIVGIEDPVRDEVPGSIEACKQAGITVRMVTGDNITTARSIAGKCGIIHPGDDSIVMEGSEFRRRVLDSDGNIIQSEFDVIWPRLRVLARSSPKDKYTLVSGLMQTDLQPYGPQVVAVTGDGTNDAPALKKANVGFAMGICGTAVAKDASDIILMDDNFASIVNAIKWGRNVYDSIAKFLQFQLTVNVVAVLLAMLGAVFIQQSPLTAVQMLWVNLIMDSFASLALATEPPTPDLLERKPYPKTQPLLSKMMSKHIFGQALLQLVVLLVLVFYGDSMFGVKSGRVADLPEADKEKPTQHMTIVFNVFVWMQLFNEINCRKIHDEMNIFKGVTNNAVFMYVVVFQVVMQVVIVQYTGMWMGCEPLDWDHWLLSIAIGFVAWPFGALLRSIPVTAFPEWMAICHEAEVVEHDEEGNEKPTSTRGQQLWIRGMWRLRAQLRVVRAFKRGLQQKGLLSG